MKKFNDFLFIIFCLCFSQIKAMEQINNQELVEICRKQSEIQEQGIEIQEGIEATTKSIEKIKKGIYINREKINNLKNAIHANKKRILIGFPLLYIWGVITGVYFTELYHWAKEQQAKNKVDNMQPNLIEIKT